MNITLRTALTIGATLALSACVGSGVDTIDEFRSAVEAGASCAELFDQRAGFSDADDLATIDDELGRIGCETAESTRTDQ